MTNGSINTLLSTAISRVQRTQNAKEPKPSMAVTLDRGVIYEAIRSGDERSILLSVASATALQKSIRAETPAFVNKIMATQPFDVIRKQFLLSDGISLDNEKLLKASKELPSKDAGKLLLLGVENSHLEVQLLDYDAKGEIDTPACNKVIRRLEQIEGKLEQIAAILDPNTLLLKE